MTMRTMKTGLKLVLAAGALAAHPASATEAGGGVYPNGAEGYSGAALPPPGTYLLGYVEHYDAGRFNDGNGNSGQLPDFHARADAAIARIVHVTDKPRRLAITAFGLVPARRDHRSARRGLPCRCQRCHANAGELPNRPSAAVPGQRHRHSGASIAGCGITCIVAVKLDADGTHRVPETILDKLSSYNVQITLILNGVPANHTRTATIDAREASPGQRKTIC